MKKQVPFFILVASIVLASCATLHRGTTQNIEISTYNNVNAANTRCSLKNEEGAWAASVNQQVMIDRDGNNLEIRCENDTQLGIKRVDPMFSRFYLYADFLAGACTVSCAVDLYQNAFYEYPATIFMFMNPK